MITLSQAKQKFNPYHLAFIVLLGVALFRPLIEKLRYPLVTFIYRPKNWTRIVAPDDEPISHGICISSCQHDGDFIKRWPLSPSPAFTQAG